MTAQFERTSQAPRLPARIHHFTSIETLALILANRTLRLNRLDRVEDLFDGVTDVDGSQRMAYASCWTEDSDSHAMWKLYSQLRGVRISIDPRTLPFEDLESGTSIPRSSGIDVSSGVVRQTPSVRGTYEVLHWRTNASVADEFRPTIANLQEVTYASDEQHIITGTKYVDRATDEPSGAKYDRFGIGLIKHRRWQFEREWRYVEFLADVPAMSERRHVGDGRDGEAITLPSSRRRSRQPQQRLNFLPEPHGQGSLRPTFALLARAARAISSNTSAVGEAICGTRRGAGAGGRAFTGTPQRFAASARSSARRRANVATTSGSKAAAHTAAVSRGPTCSIAPLGIRIEPIVASGELVSPGSVDASTSMTPCGQSQPGSTHHWSSKKNFDSSTQTTGTPARGNTSA